MFRGKKCLEGKTFFLFCLERKSIVCEGDTRVFKLRGGERERKKERQTTVIQKHK
jgi:hypothetical protein